MNAKQLMDQILPVLYTVKEDKVKLQKILDFMMAEIYEEPQPDEIPEKYRKVVHDIAENIDCGLVCYLNPETLDLEDVPENIAMDPDEFEMVTGELWNETFKHDQWERCITIEPREGHEAFKIMERFVDEIEDKMFAQKLAGILNRKRPFANFKAHVENSEYRQQWFDFKQAALEEMVWDEISFQIETIE
ncbi:MAG: hypothetical protein K9H26_07795 [Prolixibacteraceae bacterium]|nr:hypothetical protein [Prolixibacteraceae bacterium]